MPDAVGQNDVAPHGVERLAGAVQLAGELRRQELAPGAAGAMEDQHRVGDRAGRIARRLPQGEDVDAELGERIARAETELAEHNVALPCGARRGAGDRHHGGQGRREPRDARRSSHAPRSAASAEPRYDFSSTSSEPSRRLMRFFTTERRSFARYTERASSMNSSS